MSGFFFVLGNPRSGTTLLRLMLNNHPSITIPPECGFMLWLVDRFRQTDFTDSREIAVFVDALVQTKKFETWQLERAPLQAFIESRAPARYREVALLVYEFYARSVGKAPRLLGDKNNFYLDYLAQIRDLFPDAKVVAIVRDGRDVACSYRELVDRRIESTYAPRLPRAIGEIAREWTDNNLRLVETLRSPGRVLVRYEDLIANPTEELGRICAVLGVPYDPAMLQYHARNAAEEQEPAEFLKWKEKTLLPPDAANAGKYRQLLTRAEIDEFEHTAGAVLAHFQYCLENPPQPS